ncbi:MAG: hypothetical protein ACTSV2_04050, partial [Candidatus Thorarchaeota archaeon]
MENSIIKRLMLLLIEPHHSIMGEKKQQQARFLSLFLLIAIPIIAGTYFTSDLLGVSAMTYLL